jgi:4-coumarate--CoA ligase
MIRRDLLFRLVSSLVADELGVQRGRPLALAETAAWSEVTRLDDEPCDAGALAFDSLARIDVSSRLNAALHLHETGVEDYLLTQKTLGGLVDVVTAALKLSHERMTFHTSGSTGAPKPCVHRIDHLRQETEALAGLLAGARRIVALVPAHHIYGFLFTVLLPDRLDCAVLDGRAWSAARLATELVDGDLVIATPHLWSSLARSLPAFPPGVTGVSSTAPMPGPLAEALIGQGLQRLVEVYGSSETAGVGWRDDPGAPFTLFAHWRASPEGLVRREPDGGDSAPFTLMDALDWSDEIRFRPTGRKDGAVQVGGVNVFPERVAAIIRAHDLVADCAVRPVQLAGDAARTRLKAFVVPAVALPEEDLLAALTAALKDKLQPLERPTQWTTGHALPRNAIGKLADW